jgi:hypothetical protein
MERGALIELPFLLSWARRRYSMAASIDGHSMDLLKGFSHICPSKVSSFAFRTRVSWVDLISVKLDAYRKHQSCERRRVVARYEREWRPLNN